jgi:hypothetical protein
MKDRFRRMWIEHKSKDKKPEEVLENDTAKALEKMISILSKSADPKLGPQTEKIKLIKEKTEKIILKTQQKKRNIQQLTKEISQKEQLIKDSITREGLDSQSKEERHKKLENEIFDLNIKLQKLKRPEPLDPLKMIDVLLYSTDTDSELSVTDITKMFDKLSGKTPSHNLIYISNNLVNTVLKTYITREIVSRKDFLDQTKKALSMVTKLPDKPGDLDNISGVVKNLQESFKNVFAYNQELYKNQIDLLAESLQLLLFIRGKLKIWIDVDRFIKQNNITSELLVNVVKKAKSPYGGGIFDLLGKDELKLLNNLVDKVELLTRDYWSFYNAFINTSSNSYLLTKVNTFRGNLITKLSVDFEPYKLTGTNKFINVKENFFETLEQTKILIQIVNSVIGEQESLIVLEYLGITPSKLNNHYHTQLVYTNLAIRQLTTIQLSFKHEHNYVNKCEIDKLYPDYFLDINHYFKNIKITNIIAEYIDIKNSAEQEYLSTLTHYNLKKKLSFLKSTQQVLNFFADIFHYQNHLKDFKDSLTVLGLMEIDLEVSEFFKVIDVRNQFNLEFIRQIIYHLIVDTFKFFSFENIKSLDSLKTRPIQQKIEEIEMYLVKNTGPMIENLVNSAILSESELLDNFSYLITSKNSFTSSKDTNPLKLLNLLISLSEYGEFSPEKLLTKESINKIITLNQDKIIKVIKKINVTGQYGKHSRGSNFNPDNKTSVLFNLIDLSCITIEIMDEFLKIGIDPNKEYHGKKLLGSIAYQLTKVIREPDVYHMPGIQKYIVSPEKQDQLIDVALHLIHQGAVVNSILHRNGFLTTLFSLIPSGQSPYLYKKLLSDKKVISQLDLQETDLWGRNLAHLFCKDLSEIFYSFTDPIEAKKSIYDMLIGILKSRNAHCQLNKPDKEGNTPWHYLASSITADYVKLKTDCSFSQFKNKVNLSLKNIYGDTPLHIAFTKKADPVAFYEFVLTDIYYPAEWLKSPRLGLKIKNNQKQTVLDMIIHTKNKLAASVINVYMAVVNYKIDLDDSSTFETIRSKVDTYLKSIPQVPADELGRTIYLGERYGSSKYDSSSSSSSLSSSSTSSMSSSSSYYVIQLDSEIIERGRTDTVYDWHTTSPLTGESDDFTLHG